MFKFIEKWISYRLKKRCVYQGRIAEVLKGPERGGSGTIYLIEQWNIGKVSFRGWVYENEIQPLKQDEKI